MKTQKNWLEWTVFALGLILVSSTLGYLVYDAIGRTSDRPLLELTLREPYQQGSHYVVPLTVHNRGGRTAEQVLVRVTLTADGNDEESAELQFESIPRLSQREGYVTFKSNPKNGQIDGRAVGYEQP